MKGLKRAVKYLQNQVTEFLGNDKEQVKQLACLIFKPVSEVIEESRASSNQVFQRSFSRYGLEMGDSIVNNSNSNSNSNSNQDLASIVYESRMALYEKLCRYFPRSMRQPDTNLIDLVN